MSISTIAQVRSSSKSTGSARTLLLIIASHVNPDTGWAWPSLDTLAHETGLQRRRTIDLIHILERLGELEVRHGQGRGHVNFYRVRVAPDETVHSSPRQKVQSPARKGAISPQEKVQSVAPERKREIYQKGAPPAPSEISPDKPERQNRFWCEACGFITQACDHRVVEVTPQPPSPNPDSPSWQYAWRATRGRRPHADAGPTSIAQVFDQHRRPEDRP